MKRSLPALLLLACLLAAAVSAADIRITAEQQEYYFLVGERADIPLSVSSSFATPVDGMLDTATTEMLQKPGIMMSRSMSRSYLHTVPPGDSTITISGGTSDVAKTMKVTVLFDYTDREPIRVSLPEIIINFVEDRSQVQNPQGRVTSTSAPGGSGVGSPTSSSIQIIQQPIQQPAQQTSQDSSPSAQLQNSQLSQNTEALRQQLEQEAQEKEENRERFLENLGKDPLWNGVNESLAADGFTLGDLSPDPKTGEEGTFTATFSNPAGGQVSAGGTLSEGSLQSVTERTDACISIPPAFGANRTFQASDSELTGGGFRSEGTEVTMTPAGSAVNLTYTNPQGEHAYLDAEETGGNVTRVTLVRDTKPVDVLPLLASAVAIAVAAAAVWFLYRRFRLPRSIRPPTMAAPVQHPPPVDYRAEAERLLSEAETAFAGEHYRDAYAHAGRALRIVISGRYGDGTELTGEGAQRLMVEKGLRLPQAAGILDACDLVEFARGSPDAEAFLGMIDGIRTVLRHDAGGTG